MRALIPVVKRAGVEILKIYAKEDFGIEFKEDESPVTLADKAANLIIIEQLDKLFPGVPILSEESTLLSFDQRKSWRECFIVDPIDGTKEFIKRNGEFTINIGYWNSGKMAEGIVYAPALELIYFTDKGRAFRIKNGLEQQLPCEKTEIFTVASSQSHLNEKTKKEIEKLRKSMDSINLLRVGSSLKMCFVAEGEIGILTSKSSSKGILLPA